MTGAGLSWRRPQRSASLRSASASISRSSATVWKASDSPISLLPAGNSPIPSASNASSILPTAENLASGSTSAPICCAAGEKPRCHGGRQRPRLGKANEVVRLAHGREKEPGLWYQGPTESGKPSAATDPHIPPVNVTRAILTGVLNLRH